ncbi:unnamed protein product [Didymodactylos carnosus]|uniref:Uncharacterized protein n=1 Tax=Didymodactylos carnosus TaxID=1234261 RepID=A0A814RHJ6_9BILA|nr:unnamed protein product [Didymodactylos carnosus]CAF1235435.1 unnamed protein product [Didymodactylos carnosus]CAF3897885.1 unnamed protein product [Didymodactylos carnosus]CAF4043323.1 unnamed protein product [Didymodactylos carnosus]
MATLVTTSKYASNICDLFKMFLETFELEHITFVLQLNENFSQHLPDKFEHLTNIVNRTFAGNYQVHQVAAIVSLFSNPNIPRIISDRDVTMAMDWYACSETNKNCRAVNSIHIQPYNCILCKSLLVGSVSSKIVQVFCSNGVVKTGTVFSYQCNHAKTDYSKQDDMKYLPNGHRVKDEFITRPNAFWNSPYLYLGGVFAYEKDYY